MNREFRAGRPDQLWVCDMTYTRTWVGFAYLALVIDVYSRRIVGWALAGHMRTELPLEALELAIWTRGRADLTGLIQHTDAGPQYLAVRNGQALTAAGAVASVGTVGDSYDNALAESTIGQLKAELIKTRGPWRSLERLEYAIFEYIDWWNHRRLHSEIGMIPPVEAESTYYRRSRPLETAGSQQAESL